MSAELNRLQDLLADSKKIAVAFSGGVDSAFLLQQAKLRCEQTLALTACSEFTPRSELERAQRVAETLGVNQEIVAISALSDERIASNPENRCYYCKKLIFSSLLERARSLGFYVLADGTNADDERQYRPGRQAAKELKVVSPLLACGLTKAQIRSFSQEAGLETALIPSDSCLATRIKHGETIALETLRAVDQAEDELRKLGLYGARARVRAGECRIEVVPRQLQLAFDMRNEILKIASLGFGRISLDLKGYCNE